MNKSFFYDVIEPWLDKLLMPWHRREARRLGVLQGYQRNMKSSGGSRAHSATSLYQAVQDQRAARGS